MTNRLQLAALTAAFLVTAGIQQNAAALNNVPVTQEASCIGAYVGSNTNPQKPGTSWPTLYLLTWDHASTNASGMGMATVERYIVYSPDVILIAPDNQDIYAGPLTFANAMSQVLSPLCIGPIITLP